VCVESAAGKEVGKVGRSLHRHGRKRSKIDYRFLVYMNCVDVGKTAIAICLMTLT
jgi:hypothetical protein